MTFDSTYKISGCFCFSLYFSQSKDVSVELIVPSGNFNNGKPSINGPFAIAMLVYQRQTVSPFPAEQNFDDSAAEVKKKTASADNSRLPEEVAAGGLLEMCCPLNWDLMNIYIIYYIYIL
jgi:hypothetical protein